MIEKEISETYYFNPDDFNEKGRSESDGLSFRDLIKDFEYDFHRRHSTEYALNLYCNSRTMRLLERACDAAPFMMYGMDLTQGNGFDATNDPFINHEMDKHSKCIYVYGIDSAFMTNFNEFGIPILSEDEDIYPLTLLVAETMRDGTIRLAVPTLDDDFEDEIIPVEAPKYELV